MTEEKIGDSSTLNLKMQKAGKEDDIDEAYVTYWQEFEQNRAQHWKEQEAQDYTVCDGDEKQDYIYRYGAEY
jgi:hypothetical protein